MPSSSSQYPISCTKLSVGANSQVQETSLSVGVNHSVVGHTRGKAVDCMRKEKGDGLIVGASPNMVWEWVCEEISMTLEE